MIDDYDAVVNEVEEMFDSFIKDARKRNNKSAGRRARVMIGKLAKKLKTFRELSSNL